MHIIYHRGEATAHDDDDEQDALGWGKLRSKDETSAGAATTFTWLT